MDAEWFSLKLVVRSLFAITVIAMMISMVHAQPPTLLWSDPVDTNAIALSANGQYVVVGTFGEVRFYGRSSSTPLWTSSAQEVFSSVAISADGSYVAAGGLGRVYFWANARSLTGNPAPTWVSVDLVDHILRRCLAISDDGNYVAACGTGVNLGTSVFYWAGATGKSGSNVATTWDYLFPSGVATVVLAIAISDDGNHVAAVGFLGTGTEGVLAYWNNARTLTGHPQPPTWSGQESDEGFVDVAISDDGNFVAVAGEGVFSTVFYWAGATTRTGTLEPHTWAGGVDVPFTSVDMSCDGNSVIAGSGLVIGAEGAAHSVYFWGGARGLTGSPAPSWIYPTVRGVADVVINDAGTYMAAVDSPIIPGTVYFFDKQGNLLWQDTDIAGNKLSISCDGGTLAVGTPTFVTAYLLDTGFSSPCCGVEAVGGLVTSRNTLSVLAPYLAVLGFAAAAIVAVAVILKKRRI